MTLIEEIATKSTTTLFSDSGYDKFSNLISITNLDKIYTIDTINMSHMFDGASSITEIDVVNFQTKNVTDTSYMFNGCIELVRIYASNAFDVRNVTESTNMFLSCEKIRSYDLAGGNDGPTYAPYRVSKTHAKCREYYENDNYGIFTDCNYRIYDGWFSVTGLDKSVVIKIKFDKFTDPIPSGTKYTQDEFNGLTFYLDGTEVTFHQDRDVYVNCGIIWNLFYGYSNLVSFENLNYLNFSKANSLNLPLVV